MKDKYIYLGKNTLIFAISSFGTKFLSFFLIPLYTNVLTTEEYGSADLITTTATLLIFVLTINIADAVLRFSIDKKSNQGDILSYGFRVLMLGTLWCALGLGVLFLTGLTDWPVYYYIFILLNFFAHALYQLLTYYMRGVDKVSEVAAAGILSSGGIIVSNILFLLVIKIGIIGYLLALVIGPMIASVYCMIVIREPLRTYLHNPCSKEIMREMKAYCIPLIFNNIALWINAFLDRYFVTGYCGVGENGIYSIANKIPTILSTCYTVFAQAWNLSAIREFTPEDSDGFFSKTYWVYNALITTVCSILILLNIPIARFLYAKEFFQAWNYSSVLLLSVMFNSLTIVIGSIFSAVKATRITATTTVISAVVNMIFNMILIPMIGALGAAIATVLAYLVMWVVRLAASRKYICFKLNWRVDCIVYALLVLQVVFEHMEGHMYIGQVACFILILIIYRKPLSLMLHKMFQLVRGIFAK